MAKERIVSAEFVMSNTDPAKCPEPNMPEYAFIGRSNVGKSSLINMLVGRKAMAKTSGTPGKTQLINHFLINNSWYIVDLPGYGYAKTSRTNRTSWEKMIKTYLESRPNLVYVFVLIDSRIDPQKNDMEFINWLGKQGIPICLVFTKIDKQTVNKSQMAIAKFNRELKLTWEALPQEFASSSETKQGREEILDFIEYWNQQFKEE
ncbi:ribosome biogenesis GTP-binding protein YihA/YsxC [Peijinzhouia sedimentorum]